MSIPKLHVESKYVSVFADAKPDVDMTFRDDLLAAPAENYMVGIDHLMVNLGSFSMVPVIKSGDQPIILEVLRLHQAAGLSHPFPDGFRVTNDNGTAATVEVHRGYRLESGTPITSFGQLMSLLGQLAFKVNEDMTQKDLQPVSTGGGYVPAIAGAVQQHIAFELAQNGNMKIHGSKAFWCNYMIYVPAVYYQQVFFGKNQELLVLNPATGVEQPEIVTIVGGNKATRKIATPIPGNSGNFHNSAHASATEIITFRCETCLFTTFDRRIALEIGTSLPIKGSPLIDFDRDSHDFILARYMFKRPGFRFNAYTNTNQYVSGRSTVSFDEDPPGLHIYEDNKTQYHQLQPQQKISQLRLKMFARVRRYNESTEEWQQQVIEVPTDATDYWFARIHFVGKE